MIKQVFTTLFTVTLEKKRIKPRGGEEGGNIFYFNTLDFWPYKTVYIHNSACMAIIQVGKRKGKSQETERNAASDTQVSFLEHTNIYRHNSQCTHVNSCEMNTLQ